MKKLTLILLLCFAASRVSSQNTTKVRYKKQRSTSASTANSYAVDIPKGYKPITLIGGHKELEKQYVYSDSAKVYISDFENGSLNYKNILLLGDSVANKRFESFELKAALSKQLGHEYKAKKITLQGKAANGLYWKDIRIGNVNIGYINVRESEKAKFDKALASFEER